MAYSDAQLTKGQRLKKLRKEILNLSQVDFGKKIQRNGRGGAQNYISKIELGMEDREVGDDYLMRIAQVYGVRFQWLAEGIGEVFENPDNVQIARIGRAASQIQISADRNKANNLVWVPVRDRGLFIRTSGDSPKLQRTAFPITNELTYAFEVADNSISRFAPGAYIFCTRLAEVQDMVVSYPYVIQTDDQLVVAVFSGKEEDSYLFASDAQTTRLACESIRSVYHIDLKLAKP